MPRDRDRDHDEGQATWREASKDGDAVAGAFLNGAFVPDPEPIPASGDTSAIYDPTPELRRQQAWAFNQEARASGLPPATKPGRFRPRSLRRT